MNLLNVIKGFFIGVALVIPGLSGSIFAVVVGLYEKLLDAVNNIRKNTRDAMALLIPVGIGAVIGILASTKLILWVCEAYPIQSYLFFTGLVIGSLPLVWKKMKRIKFNPLLLFLSLGSFIIIMYITEIGSGNAGDYIAIHRLSSFRDFAKMVYAGVFSVSLMAIPGVSGSIMLMVINQYGTVYNAVGAVTDIFGYLAEGSIPLALDAFLTVALMIPFMAGAALGILFIARVMRFLLNQYEAQVYYCVLGLVAAAIAVLVRTGVLPYVAPGSLGRGPVPPALIGGLCIAAGVLCTVFLDKPEDC